MDALVADPALGMVFCDMRVVDEREQLVRPSQVGAIGEFPRRAFARLLCQNVATQSSILVRRELVRPIPAEIPYSDWWFALRAAEHAEVLYIPEQLALYREHGANLTSGVSGAAGVREHRKEITFQLWALRNLDLELARPAGRRARLGRSGGTRAPGDAGGRVVLRGAGRRLRCRSAARS